MLIHPDQTSAAQKNKLKSPGPAKIGFNNIMREGINIGIKTKLGDLKLGSSFLSFMAVDPETSKYIAVTSISITSVQAAHCGEHNTIWCLEPILRVCNGSLIPYGNIGTRQIAILEFF